MPCPADAARLSGHCRALLAAADALCLGGHLQMRAGTLLRLCLFATTQLSLCATAALMDPEARPHLQPQIEVRPRIVFLPPNKQRNYNPL